MQQGMLFHALRDGGDGRLCQPGRARSVGFDAGKLRAAWQAVSDRHAVLRTGFVWQQLSGSAQQVVYRHVEVPFVEEDWRARAASWTQPRWSRARGAGLGSGAQGFDLSRPPLQRVRLIRLAKTATG